MTKEQQAALDLLYNTFSPLGYDMASIAGIGGNGLTESGLNGDSVSASKNYHGAWQNHTSIKNAIMNQYKDYSMLNQMKYIDDWNNKADWIMNGKNAAYTATNAGKYKKAGYKTARDAADAFMRLYERPVIIKNGKVVGYQGADSRYANAEAAYQYLHNKYGSKKKILPNLQDANKIIKFTPSYEDILLSDALAVRKQPIIQPVRTQLTEVQPVAYTQRAIPDVIVKGNRVAPLVSQPRKDLFDLDALLDIGGPEDQLKQYMAEALGIPNMHLKFPTYKDGKPGEDEPIDGGTPFSITVTGKDRRPAWRRMYENPHLASTDTYYNRDAIKNITEWVPGIGDVQQGFDAYDAAKKGNYTEAAMLGGLLLLPNIVEDPLRLVNKGLFDAFKYKYSSDYRKFVQDFINETSAKGIKLNPELFAHTSQSKAPYVVIEPRKKGHVASYHTIDNKLSVDFDQLNDVEKRNVPYHEGLHWLKVGETNSHLELLYNEALHARDMGAITDNEYSAAFSNWYDDPIYKQGRDYENILRDRVSRIIYPNSDDYFLKNPHEAVVRGLEAGRAIGVLPFLKHPGLRAEYDAFNKAREYDSFLYDIKNQLGVWSLLNGTFAP